MAPLLPHDVETTLISGSDDSTLKNHTRDVHILSAAFLLIFLAYGATQNLQSTQNTGQDLGTTSLGILYTSLTFFSLVASVAVRMLGSKNALVLGTTGYLLYVAANLMPNWFTMIPASLYLGFCASIIWVGQGTYLTLTARSYARAHNLLEGAVIGDFNGEFWAVLALYQLIGNLLTFTLLKDGQEGNTKGTALLFIVFLSVLVIGVVLLCFLNRGTDKIKEELSDSGVGVYSSLKSLSKSHADSFSDIRMLLIIPLIAYSGLQQAFVWAEFTKYVVTPKLGISGVGCAMAVYGAFDTLCSLAAGRLTSGLTSTASIVSAGTFVQAGVIVLLLVNSRISSGFLDMLYPLFLAALLGIGNGVFNTQLNALLGMLFKHDTEGAFAQLKIWQSAPTAILFFLSPHISFQAMLVVMLASLLFSFGAFLLLTLQLAKTSSCLME